MSEPRISRRQLLGGIGVAGAAAVTVGGLVGVASAAHTDEDAEAGIVPFHDAHQAGVATVRPSYLVFAAYDTSARSRDELRALFAAWTGAAELLTQGQPVGDVDGDVLAPPDDNGEALGLGPANLTITFGVGPTLFETADGTDRFELAARRPDALIELPVFGGDALEASKSGGDLCVQACADDPQVAFHAVRTMTRIARGAADIKWQQLGFLPTHAQDPKATPRNLLGFHDGTNDIRPDDEQALAESVWIAAGEGPDWMAGGSYAVVRRIRMLIEVWDRSSLDDQQQTIGRHKVSGAPLTGVQEFDAPDLTAVDAEGTPMIAADAHIRLASPSVNGGVRILRRSYSFSDGVDPRLGQLDAGLFFVSFQRDARRQFVPIQRRLSELDSLNEYIKHVGSAIFAIPPGVQPGGTIAAALFA